jgi:hypothetical protein
MDATRFDRLSRRVGAQTDRREMLKAALGGTLALLGAGTLARDAAAAATGYNGDTCASAADCQIGLICQGSTSGLLGGALAGTPYGPGIELPLISGRTGVCRYRDGCAKSEQACRNTGDCCSGLGLHCHNNKCKRD